MEIIHTEKTYTEDCTSSGFRIEIRDNKTMRVTSRARWQGSRTDEVWIVQTPMSILEAIKNEEAGDDDLEEPDIQTAVLAWLRTDWESSAKKIRSGYTIR